MTAEWTTETLKEHIESLLALRDHALELQATEYLRRLENLNHAHEQAREVLATYLPRETWEAWNKDQAERWAKTDSRLSQLLPAAAYDQRHQELVARVEEVDRWRANLQGRLAGMAVLLAIFIASVSALVTHLFS